MRINLVSDLGEGVTLDGVKSPNQVYTWFIHKELVNTGVNVRLLRCNKLNLEPPPETDHTIVVSAATLTYMMREEGYAQRLRDSTKGKLTAYFNTDELRGKAAQWFDYCFTQIEPRDGRPPKYICVGWGVDPSYSYPEQDEMAAFYDSKTIGAIWGRWPKKIYRIYDSVLPTLDLKVYNPVRVYNSSTRLPYPDYQAILRKCHFFLGTQWGEGGLNRLEAAACGALLVIHRKFYRKRTMSMLNHRTWYTEGDLREILSVDVDIEANRKRALEHRWGDVAKRILNLLDS